MLQSQTIEIPLAGGIETKADAKVVQPGSVLDIRNAEFGKVGAISKRNGFSALSKRKTAGGLISKARTLHKYKNAMAMHDGDNVYVWEPSQAKWLNAGTLIGVSAISKELPFRAFSSASPSVRPVTAQMVVVNGVAVYSYRDIGGSGVAGVLDAATGAVLIQPTLIGAPDDVLRIAVSGGVVMMAYGNPSSAGLLAAHYIDTNTLPTSFTQVTLASDFNTAGLMDIAAVDGSGNFVAVYENTTPRVKILLFTTAGAGSSTTIAEDPDSKHIGVVVSAAGHIYVAWRNVATNRPRTAVYTSALASVVAAKDLSTTAGSDQFAGVEESTNTVRWVYSITASNQRRVISNTVTSGGTVGGESTVRRSAFVASRPFVYNSVTYVLLGYTSGNSTGLQSGYYLATVGGVIAARFLGGFGLTEDNFTTNLPSPAYVTAVSSGVYWIGTSFKTSSSLLLDTYYPQPGYVVLDFSARVATAEIGDNLLLASGGLVHEFDGSSVCENNFFVYPEPLTLSATTNGSLANGTYQVIAVYAAFDSHGQIHFGPPCPAQSITLTGANDEITVVVPNLRMTNRATTSSWIFLYMTDVGGSVFYEVAALANSITSDTQTTTLTTVTGLTDNRTLYTTGGLLENGAPPALASIVRVGERVYGMDQSGVINYTKEHIEGEGAAFVPEVMVRKLSGAGPYILGDLDGRLVAIGSKSVEVLSGEGLDDTGATNTLSSPQKIAADDGALDGSPVAFTSQGVFYKSQKGPCVLDRSLAVQFIGAPVADHKDLDTVSAVVIPERNQVAFGHSDGETLVYDYHVGKWSVFDNHEQVHAIVTDDGYTVAKSDGSVWQKSDGFTDGDEQPIPMVVRTPWIKLSGLQGFQRLLYVSVIGEWRSNHTLTMRVFYDYKQDADETVEFSATSAEHGYSAGDPLQFRHHLGRKCQAVMFELSDNAAGEGLELTTLALDVGVKGKVARQSSSKTT